MLCTSWPFGHCLLHRLIAFVFVCLFFLWEGSCQGNVHKGGVPALPLSFPVCLTSLFAFLLSPPTLLSSLSLSLSLSRSIEHPLLIKQRFRFLRQTVLRFPEYPVKGGNNVFFSGGRRSRLFINMGVVPGFREDCFTFGGAPPIPPINEPPQPRDTCQ